MQGNWGLPAVFQGLQSTQFSSVAFFPLYVNVFGIRNFYSTRGVAKADFR